jgi:hypothetical protein
MAAAAGLFAVKQPAPMKPALSLKIKNTFSAACHLPDTSSWIGNYEVEMMMVDG